jgi:hypothetical protein
MSRIVRWETPFVDEFYPSVLAVAYPAEGGICARIFVSGKSNKWFSVDFGEVLVCNIMDEGCCPQRDFGDALFDPAIRTDAFIASLRWLESPWLKAYEPCHDPFSESKLAHYLIFGGDSNVEVITMHEPTILTMKAGDRIDVFPEEYDLPSSTPPAR